MPWYLNSANTVQDKSRVYKNEKVKSFTSQNRFPISLPISNAFSLNTVGD